MLQKRSLKLLEIARVKFLVMVRVGNGQVCKGIINFNLKELKLFLRLTLYQLFTFTLHVTVAQKELLNDNA